MNDNFKLYADWNPWHGCTKISPGCKYCYVYRQDEMHGNAEPSCECRKTQAFTKPIKRKRDGSYVIRPGQVVFTCFTSDFLLKDADEWRPDCWKMIRQRPDCYFYFFTKRIDRLEEVLPPDWGEGYDNVLIGCTVENQDRADFRLPIFNRLPVKHRSIICAPLIGSLDLRPYLNPSIEEVSVGGESGQEARVCDYAWVESIREQCIEADIPFRFHQTGAFLKKGEKVYRIPRRYQKIQAHRAGIDYRIGKHLIPESVQWTPPQELSPEEQLSLF